MTRGGRDPLRRTPSIGIVGAGFSGSLLAIHLLRRATAPLDIVLIEKRAMLGRGVAYSTGNAHHLLNVRAGNMSAFEDDPEHFLGWLRAQGAGVACEPGAFAPRQLYGRYIAAQLERAATEARYARLHRRHVAAIELSVFNGDAWLRLEDGDRVVVDKVVLCVGNFPPATPHRVDGLDVAAPYYLADPWDQDALASIAPRDPVLLLGTGLTMVDVAMGLEDRGHHGPILALSRHGLLPRLHAACPPAPVIADAAQAPATMSQLFRLIRAAIARSDDPETDWRGVIDGLRPFTRAIWQRLPTDERRRFLRHLQARWDVHRHRIAPSVAARIDSQRARGRLTVEAGSLVSLVRRRARHVATWAPRGGGALRTFPTAWLINCTGPLCDYSRIRDPLIRNLLALGRARPDPLRLGLDTDDHGALRDHGGMVSDWLYALGPPTRGAFWEITAVPDIRKAAVGLAAHLLADARPAEAAAPAPVSGDVAVGI